MQTRRLGRTGWPVSAVGFGAWGLGGGWGRMDDAEAVRALETYLDRGGNFIDTAYAYGDGHSERLIGQVLRRRGGGPGFYVATKVPPKNFAWPLAPGTPVTETFPREWVIACAEESLRRLGMETLDLLQLHIWLDTYNEQLDWYEAMVTLREQGKVRAFGVSLADYDPESGVRLAESGRVEAIQVIYNLFEQKPEERLFPAAQAHGVGILARVPFEEGALSGAVHAGMTFDPQDWRRDYFTPERLEVVERRVAPLRAFLDAGTPDLAALALRFCLSHPAVSSALAGMRRARHVEANTRHDTPLPPETVARLRPHAWDHGWRYPWCAA